MARGAKVRLLKVAFFIFLPFKIFSENLVAAFHQISTTHVDMMSKISLLQADFLSKFDSVLERLVKLEETSAGRFDTVLQRIVTLEVTSATKFDSVL